MIEERKMSEESFDDCFDGINKITVGEDNAHGIAYLKVDYVSLKDGRIVEKKYGRIVGEQIKESVFEVDYPNEYITRINAKYLQQINNRVLVLQFKTSRGSSSRVFGEDSVNEEESIPATHCMDLNGYGTELVGLRGRCGEVINEIGARFATGCVAHKPSRCVGGSFGVPWDDRAYEVGVSRVCVGESQGHLSYIKVEYSGGQVHSHGLEPMEEPKEFAVIDDEEYITSIEGTYDDNDDPELKVLLSLRFRTSQNRESVLFGKAVGKRFVIRGEGFHTKIVGFRGLSDPSRLIGLGANFAVAPPRESLVVANGSARGWNDGVHERVRKIRVTSSWKSITRIGFEYIDHGVIVKGGQRDVVLPATEPVSTETFELGVHDFVTAVEVCMTTINETLSIAVLKLRTNTGTVRVLGADCIGSNIEPVVASMEYSNTFTLQKRGHKVVGFFGRSSNVLEEIGVYVEPIDE